MVSTVSKQYLLLPSLTFLYNYFNDSLAYVSFTVVTSNSLWRPARPKPSRNRNRRISFLLGSAVVATSMTVSTHDGIHDPKAQTFPHSLAFMLKGVTTGQIAYKWLVLKL